MRTLVALLFGALLLSGCAETFMSKAELERAEQRKVQLEKNPPVPHNNTDPRKGKVKLDRHCGFLSCQETTMRCVGSTLILTGADGSVARVPDAEECKS